MRRVAVRRADRSGCSPQQVHIASSALCFCVPAASLREVKTCPAAAAAAAVTNACRPACRSTAL